MFTRRQFIRLCSHSVLLSAAVFKIGQGSPGKAINTASARTSALVLASLAFSRVDLRLDIRTASGQPLVVPAYYTVPVYVEDNDNNTSSDTALIAFQGMTAKVAAESLIPIAPYKRPPLTLGAQLPMQTVVVVPRTWLHEYAAAAAPIIDAAEYNTLLTVTDRVTRRTIVWYKVQCGTRQAWIQALHLRPVNLA